MQWQHRGIFLNRGGGGPLPLYTSSSYNATSSENGSGKIVLLSSPASQVLAFCVFLNFEGKNESIMSQSVGLIAVIRVGFMSPIEQMPPILHHYMQPKLL